ncbi:MAG TPA: GNAT family N-acetyltransferase [Anaerolineales bacterium]|nr:GNAT family N-acetyltransferase [Anaerolineales bacterium]
MKQKANPRIRLLERSDIPKISDAFRELGWNKPASQYERYFAQQEIGVRNVYIAWIEEQFAGYLTICWESSYEPFFIKSIPEIVDFNILPDFRRKGIGTQLMDKAECQIAKVSSVAGIGVGITSDYGAAQRLYILRGYIPDGCGLHWRDHHVHYREEIRVDDDLALYLTKELK